MVDCQEWDRYSMDEVTQEMLDSKHGYEEFMPLYENPKDWRFHLQQLVLAENRIEYLKQFNL